MKHTGNFVDTGRVANGRVNHSSDETKIPTVLGLFSSHAFFWSVEGDDDDILPNLGTSPALLLSLYHLPLHNIEKD